MKERISTARLLTKLENSAKILNNSNVADVKKCMRVGRD